MMRIRKAFASMFRRWADSLDPPMTAARVLGGGPGDPVGPP